MSNIFTGNVLILLQEKMLRRGNQNPYIKEEQTTQRSKVKGQKVKQRSIKHTQ